MNTLEKHNNEVQDNLMKLWDEKKEKLGLGEYSDEIALHIENQNTELLKKIAKGEIEGLKKQIQLHKHIIEIYETAPFEWHEGRKEEAQASLTHWQQVLQDLEK